ncbi:sugar transporter [Pedobacter sp. BS3]|uniref:sugar transporter n=1 Tax=Pedobacter sp. BS3 TaxID=2567937 RepID=UPI0011EDBF84|nr:sugar transporter [Pedobacter sp. BS3]TZF83632.1 sugar transporter [Pedobacter sp. BS3]
MSRVKNTLLNSKVNLIFYTLTTLISIYSRKIFLNYLGAEYLGLGTTVGNLLSLLNLAELGMGTAIAYSLYTPLYNNDKQQIEYIVSILGYLYKRIGILITTLGIILSLFLPHIFKKSQISETAIYATFFSYLLGSTISYFINYKQLLLIADQKNYLVTVYLNSTTICKIMVQILVVIYSKGNFYFYLIIEVIFTLIQALLINHRVSKEYNWLKPQLITRKIIIHKYDKILSNVKQIFSHHLASFVLTQTDQLLIFAFLSLKMVTYYSNYLLVIQKLIILSNQILSSNLAGIGHLIASNNYSKIKGVFQELLVLRYWAAGIIIFCLYQFLPLFINLWIGPQFILNKYILVLLLINSFIIITRQTVDNFLTGYGIFKDTWAPWTEAGLNIIFSIALGSKFGITGILMGTTISLIAIVVIWKPCLLYKSGFKESVRNYWTSITGYIILCFTCMIFMNYFLSHTFIKIDNKYFLFIIQVIIGICGYSLLYTSSLYVTSKAMRTLLLRFWNLIKNDSK